MWAAKRFNVSLQLHASKRFFRAQKDAPANAYTSTLQLPVTDFPIRAEAFKKEPLMLDLCCDKVYSWQAQAMKGKQSFVLHDGPPFANGSLHMGHLLNKVLKDVTNRYKLLQGHRISFFPGWDCHGLPIELKALEALRASKGDLHAKQLSPIQIRELARGFASTAIKGQKEDFRRWGIMGDWDNSYLTMHPEFEAEQLDVFMSMFSRGLIYRARKPVFWSPASQTALAEAELEYVEDHESPSVYVGFELSQVSSAAASAGLKTGMKCVIWTTTPWTLPSNQAICYLPKLSYVIVNRPEGSYVIANDSFERICKILEWDNTLESCKQFRGDVLSECVCTHPFLSQSSPLLPGDHVTGDTGTGLVHTAPSHGLDDFYVCQSVGIHPGDPKVDERGVFTAEAGEFEGKYVLKEGNEAVIEKLRDNKALLHMQRYRHQYPYDWRSKTPVIFRATEQWFCILDKLQHEAVEALKSVHIVPPVGRNRFEADIKNRKEWCLSRQRHWGVPIPVFYDENGAILMTTTSISYVKSLVSKHGVDCWWSMPTNELLAPEHRNDGHTYTRGTDTMDVWFDSGSSWKAVLQPRGIQAPADLYLEGSDQYRGWFQSSLLTSVASSSKAPYRAILTHGFTLDEKGHKMSKSLGNVLEPNFFINGIAPSQPKQNSPVDSKKKSSAKSTAYGVDVLRLWAVSRDFTADVTVGPEIIERVSDTLRKYRGVCRFLLGCLEDFTPQDRVPLDKLRNLDRYVLQKIHSLQVDITAAYESFQYYRVYHLTNIAVRDLFSAFYLDIIKDRLYCDEKNGLSRRSAQTVLAVILETLLKSWAPIVCFTAEEVYKHMSDANKQLFGPLGSLDSVFTQGWIQHNTEFQDNQEINDHFNSILEIRTEFMRLMDSAKRGEKALKLGSSLEALVVLAFKPGSKIASSCQFLGSELQDLLMVSDLHVVDALNSTSAPSILGQITINSEQVEIQILRAKGQKCERCWKYHEQCSKGVCPRCVGSLNSN